jgi:transcriptional regulator with XRE-family HTH domain
MLSGVKTDEQQRARALRAEGWSVKEIERQLGVARSSVSRWVSDVPLGAAQRARLAERSRLGPIVAAERKSAAARERRSEFQLQGRRLAHERDASYAAGCMLHWAEGEKCRGRVAVSNSDVELLRVFAAFLRRHFDVQDEAMRVHCFLFADHLEQQRAIEDHWLEGLALPRTALMKSTVNTYSKYSQKKRVNKLPYGTCSLIVHSTRIVQTIYGSIQEYGGFERPDWLD